jgi:hypothetical protein
MDARDIIAHTMNRDIPENIHEDIRVPAILLRQSLQHSGWFVGKIEWDNENQRTVKCVVKPPLSVQSILISCPESSLAGKFRQLLLSGAETGGGTGAIEMSNLAVPDWE